MKNRIGSHNYILLLLIVFGQTLSSQTIASGLSVGFEKNVGQVKTSDGLVVSSVLYKLAVPDLDIYVTTKGLTYVFKKADKSEENIQARLSKELPKPVRISYSRIEVELENAVISSNNIVSESLLTFYKNYLLSSTQKFEQVYSYEKLTVKNIYPFVDWILSVKNTAGKVSLKYDFILHPGADPKVIKLRYDGAKQLNLVNEIAFEFTSRFGKITEGDCS